MQCLDLHAAHVPLAWPDLFYKPVRLTSVDVRHVVQLRTFKTLLFIVVLADRRCNLQLALHHSSLGQLSSHAYVTLVDNLLQESFQPDNAGPFAAVSPAALSSACAKSAMRSSVPSMPTLSRISDSDIPAACNCAPKKMSCNSNLHVLDQILSSEICKRIRTRY